MKYLIVTFILFLSTLSLLAEETGELKLTLKLQKGKEGVVYVALYNSKESWMKPEKMVGSREVDPEGKTEITVIFNSLPNGEYALTTFQDENGNGKLDFGLFFVPKESYGLSNDAKGVVGPPSFKDATFNIKGDTSFLVELH